MIFLRHPTPKVEPGTCYGQTDLDVAETAEAEIAAALTATPKVSRILASPAKRCRRLAEAVAGRDGLELQFDERLWEMHMGEWEGLLWREIDRAVSELWLKDPFNLPVPGGESFKDVQQRVLAAVASADTETAIICHAGPIRAVQMAWQGLTFKEAFSSTPGYAEPIRILPPETS